MHLSCLNDLTNKKNNVQPLNCKLTKDNKKTVTSEFLQSRLVSFYQPR